MGRVTTNTTSVQFARETTLGVLPVSANNPVWKLLEPNDISDLGPTIATAARRPLSGNRQARKGAITDLDSAVGFTADLTADAAMDFIGGFLYARNSQNGLVWYRAATANGSYSAATSTDVRSRLRYASNGPTSLLYAEGYSNEANNGLKVLGAAAAANSISVAGVVEETNPPANATLELAGIRGGANTFSFDVTSSARATLTASGVDFTTLGLFEGQELHIGGMEDANRFIRNAEPLYGYGRIVTITANTIVLDEMTPNLTRGSGNVTGTNIDILFGRAFRNVHVGHPDYDEASFTFEGVFPNLGDGGEQGYAYSLGNLCNSITINLARTELAGVTFGFIGTDTMPETLTRADNADDPRTVVKDSAFGASSDIGVLAIQDVDDMGLSSYFRSMAITVNNNVTPEKVIGLLGARWMNVGNLDVTFTAEAIFSNRRVSSAIRNNTTLSLHTILTNGNGAIAISLPAFTMGGGNRSFTANESVVLNLTGTAFADARYNASMIVTYFPVAPKVPRLV